MTAGNVRPVQELTFDGGQVSNDVRPRQPTSKLVGNTILP